MPSGYTSRIHDGQDVTFPEFAMTCARAFGALIEMRDEDMDAPVPDEFTPRPYYQDAIEQAGRRLRKAEAWTPGQAEAEAATEHAEAVRDIGKCNAEARALRQRYAAMLASVELWEPPTPDHAELKAFMAGQLRESARFDCTEMAVPEALTGAEYRARVIEEATASLERARKHRAEEVERARGRTEWVRALRASLTEAATAHGPGGERGASFSNSGNPDVMWMWRQLPRPLATRFGLAVGDRAE